MRERVGENINRALHRLFRDDAGVYLLGEDVLDPYGGAFRVTKGLSTSYPDRVLTTPLSENAIVGVGAGLALTGNRVIVEVMFGDFVLLAFDQLVNFAAKSVAMYGRPVPVPLVVRCPVGGNRGYGPTHSQSPQKHLIGVPHLSLYEMSPLHDAHDLLSAALDRAEPAVFLEDKVLYTQWHRPAGAPDDGLECRALPGPGMWVRVDRAGAPAPDVVLIAGGGMVHRALEALRLLRERDRLTVTLLVPGQLYPFEAGAVLPLVEAAGLVCVAEEGTRGGSWGTEVAAVLHQQAWGRLLAPVALVTSAASVIPAAPHLEREVLVQAGTIADALVALCHRGGAGRSAPAHRPAPAAPAGGPAPTGVHEIVVATLNPNDDHCVLVDWLVPEGGRVAAGTAVATVETSKATADIEAERDGVLHRLRDIGEEIRFGETIGHLVDPAAVATPTPAPTVRADPGAPRPVNRNQAAVAAAVTASHHTIPAAFGAIEVDLDAATAFLDVQSRRVDAVVDLPTLIVKAVAALHGTHSGIFVSVGADGEPAPMPADVGVAMDAGAGLFVPVVRDAHQRDWADVADDLTDLRMSALAGDFAAAQLTGAAISVSLNLVPAVTVVTPLILPPQAAMVSVAGPRRRVRLDGAVVVEVDCVTVGLAYDHRVINGRAATDFLAAIKELIEDPARISIG